MTALAQDTLVLDQHGVLTHRQALRLFSPGHIRAQLAAKRWQRPRRGVLVLHNGPLTDTQRAWVALLSCPPDSALAGLSALHFDGFEGFTIRHDEHQVVLPEGADRPRDRRIVPHWSTMLGPEDVHPLKRPRRTRAQRSLVDEASWSSNPRRARAIVLAGVQQRLVRTTHLKDALSRRGPCRHRALIVESILDAAGGIQSLPERDYEQIRRQRRLPEPTRQRVVRRNDGRYFLDLGWDEFDAACEIHGIPHLAVLNWDQDIFRSNEIIVEGPRLLVFSSYAVRHEGQQVGEQTERLLRRGGWRG